MAVKRTTTRRKSGPKAAAGTGITHLPDVFDEEVKAETPAVVNPPTVTPPEPEVAEPEEKPEEPEVAPEPLKAPRAPRVVTEVEEEAPVEEATPEPEVAPEPPKKKMSEDEPSFTVRQNGQTVETQLPPFLAEENKGEAPAPMATAEPETKPLEQMVPQAFVGEVRETAKEVKRERKGTIVTAFIILGMVLVAAGAVGLFFMNSKRSETAPSPSPATEVQATPAATPNVVVETAPAASSAATVSASEKQGVKVNVLNGTTTKGLAAKEAAILKADGFTLGTVGNGNPSDAGTIKAPTGTEGMVAEIQSKLTGFSFTVASASGKEITVTLGQPQN